MAKIKDFPAFLRGRESWNNNWQAQWTKNVQTAASGRIRTMTTQLYPAWTVYLQYNSLTDNEADELQGFLNQCANGYFWYKDYQRYRATKQILARNTDGSYQCIINIGGFIEPALRVDNVTVYKNGVPTTNFTVADGKISLKISVTDRDVITADYDYYFKCRCKDSTYTINRNFINSNNVALYLCVVR